MKTINLSVLLVLLFATVAMTSLAWAEQGSDKQNQNETQGLRAVEKTDALAPGTDAANSVMKDTPAMPLQVAAVIVGNVVSVDPAKNTLTIKEDKTGKHHTLSVINSDVLQTLKKGSKVHISIPVESQTTGAVFKT